MASCTARRNIPISLYPQHVASVVGDAKSTSFTAISLRRSFSDSDSTRQALSCDLGMLLLSAVESSRARNKILVVCETVSAVVAT